jgi:uncharacterized protein
MTGQTGTQAPGSDEQTAPRGVVELSREECLELLAAATFGRVVLSSGSRQTPIIRPVNYRFDRASQSVVFRTGGGSKFHALARSATALFEIDAIEPSQRSGWSVIVGGVTEQVTRPAEVRRLEQLGVESWAAGERPFWIRLRARTVSGRRIGLERG